MKTLGKKCLVSLIIAFAAAVLLEISVINTIPKHTTFHFGTVDYAVYSRDAKTVNCTMTDGIFTPSSDDPQLYFSVGDISQRGQKIASLRIAFVDPAEEKFRVQVFYPGEDGSYKEGYSRMTWVKPGQQELVMNIPAGNYSELRIDFDGVFTLDRIEFSDTYAEKTYASENFNPERFFGLWAICFAVIFLLQYFKIFCRIKTVFVGLIDNIRSNPKRARKVVIVTVLVTFAVCVLTFIALHALGKRQLPSYYFFTVSLSISLCLVFFFFKHTGTGVFFSCGLSAHSVVYRLLLSYDAGVDLVG